MTNVHCLNPISPVGLNEFSPDYQLVDKMEDAQCFLVRSADLHQHTFSNQLVSIARAGAGVNNIPLDKAMQQGIVVFNTPGANANAVKELVLAGMLLSSRDIYGGIEWVKKNHDDPTIHQTVEKAKKQFGGTEIFHKTIGIIGLGAIGMKLAQNCLDLGMQVIGFEMNPDIKKHAPKEVVTDLSYEDGLKLCDFISIHVPLLPATTKMINQDMIYHMKDGVVILNFARDLLVDEDALEEALTSRKVKTYVTDFPNTKVVNMDHVIAIPHLGASTEEAEENCAYMAVWQTRNFIEHGEIKNSVNAPNLSLKPKETATRLTFLIEADEQTLDAHINIIKSHVNYIENIQYATRKEISYIVIDTNEIYDEDRIQTLRELNGVLKVRTI